MENGVLQIGYEATEDDLTNRVYNNFVRTNPPRAQEAYVAPMLTYNVFGWTRIAFVKAYTTYGFHASFKYDIYFTDRLGIPANIQERTDHIIYPIQTDYTDIIEEIRATKFRILFLFADADHGAAFLSAAYKANLLHEGTQLIVGSVLSEPAAWKVHLGKTLQDSEIAEVLKGAIAFRPILNRTIPPAVDFINRFRSLPSTLGNDTHCDQSKDVEGIYYNQNADGTVCAGLNFSSFLPSGSDIAKGAFYAYDAVVALTLGLHKHLYVEHLESLLHTPYHYYYLMMSFNAVQFDGASGHVAFEPFPDRQNNDRLTNNLYEVVNFDDRAFLMDNNMGFFRVGYINTDTGFTYCDTDTDSECRKFVFNTRNGQVPSDRPPLKTLYMPLVLRVLLLALSVLTIITVLLFSVGLFVFRRRRLIRVLQPEFAILMFTGCILLAANAIIESLRVTNLRCMVTFCLAHLGCCLVTTPLVAKTARINVVLNSRLRKVRVSIAQSYLLSLALLSPIFIGTAIIIAQNDISVGSREITNSLELHTRQLLCIGGTGPVVNFIYTYQAFLMLTGFMLCYPIRNLPAGISDVSLVTKGAMGVYVVCSPSSFCMI